MSRKGLTKVEQSKIVAIMDRAGLECKANAGFLKFHKAGAGIRRSLGVPTTKSVTRVELVGFESTTGTVAHPKPPAATVTQMVDFAQDEKLVLKAIWDLASTLASFEAEVELTVKTGAEPEAGVKFDVEIEPVAA
jgi:hypothetical protein